jgi:hypothetical protein
MFRRNKSAASLLPTLGFLMVSGCGMPSNHPNQMNSFDGATYDSLLVAHGALSSLRGQVALNYPKYTPMFNQAVASYAAAYSTYSIYRTKPTSQSEVALAIGNLTVAIVAIENAFQSDMHAPQSSVADIRARAKGLRTSAKQAGITLSDILTELQIAAAVAQAIPQTAPYARLAQIVIASTRAALAELAANDGQPIDLSLIQPILPLE